ncbi:MAG: helix-turn-helix transcriptional regulator [Bacteroidales bacterium]|nr:helix-turn-helix transcriptional regulator [Bacteroidales bacterium]
MYSPDLFKERFSRLLENGFWTIKEFSEKCGLHPNTVYNILHGKGCPYISTVCDIADFFNVSIDYLVGRESGGEK